jgi:hypothetical protein
MENAALADQSMATASPRSLAIADVASILISACAPDYTDPVNAAASNLRELRRTAGQINTFVQDSYESAFAIFRSQFKHLLSN